ncbi:MAG TPA: DUF2207 domain-containing protein [Thermoanaerobaculia bacterium]|nr:DUF2207 domain-containing protein [Thermoanaerobaculia bacterium]
MKRLLVLLLLAFPAVAQRSLEWESIAVTARLDAAGALHVSEEQTYLFNGEWNGGERTVRLEKEQRFTFDSLSRRDEATGELQPLSYGSLDVVDGYLVNGESIRWRSRLPSDRPFRNQRITYVVEYTLANILMKRGRSYRLDHDFAFPDRPGVIRRLTVDLELDPAWQSDSLERRYEAGPLPPGRGFVVKGTLDFRGSGPAPEAQIDTLYWRAGLAALLLVVPAALWWLLLRREEKLGRFAPLNAAGITPKWIEENLVTIPAELAGAAWDEDVGESEVSALLARWVAEDKVTSRTTSPGELKLHLIVPREAFDGYERDLIDKLFFAGDETSTSAIRAHYASSGFNPTRIIRRKVLKRAYDLGQLSERALRLGSLITAPALLAAAYFLNRGWSANQERIKFIMITLIALSIVSLVAVIAAMIWRGRIDHGRDEMKVFRSVIVFDVIVVLVILAGNFFSFDAQLASSAFALMLASLIIDSAKSKRGRSAIAFRKRLASAREYLAAELEKSSPAIDNQWFPWVIAFGLDSEASRWVTRFGDRLQSTADSRSSYTSTSSSSSGSGTPTWSGGGGAFGGAGASGSWAMAAGGLAAGVAAPSSSSSGGGGSSSSSGGGSSSSGGGSGGGW